MNKLRWLTGREREVLGLMMSGLSAQEIAREMYVGLPTVRSHVRSILMKLNCTTQLQAVAYAYAACWPADHCRETAVRETLKSA